MTDNKERKRKESWTFLTNHAHVLLCLAQAPQMRMREIADRVGITERAVQQIIADLAETGYIDREKAGRRNVYSIHQGKPLRHSIEGHRSIAHLIELIEGIDEEESTL